MKKVSNLIISESVTYTSQTFNAKNIIVLPGVTATFFNCVINVSNNVVAVGSFVARNCELSALQIYFQYDDGLLELKKIVRFTKNELKQIENKFIVE